MHILANTLSPLMITTVVYLLWANILIGIVEGLILRFIFKAKRFPEILLVPANYLSAWLGMGILGLTFANSTFATWFLGSDPLSRLFAFSCLLTVAAFILSVLLEWPVIHFTHERKSLKPTSSLIASLTVNAISYTLLLTIGAFLGLNFPYAPAKLPPVVDRATLSPVDHSLLLWVDPDGRWLASDFNHPESAIQIGQIQQTKQHMDAGIIKPILFQSPEGYTVRLLRWWDRNETRGGTHGQNMSEPQTIQSILSRLPEFAGLQPIATESNIENHYRDVIDWRNPKPDGNNIPHVYYDYFASYVGIGPTLTLTFEAPGYDDLRPYWPSVLPDGRIVFGLGQNVMLYDPAKHCLARIARGNLPVVIPLVPTPATQPQ